MNSTILQTFEVFKLQKPFGMAVNLEDLWIGDRVRSVSRGITGKYAGLARPGVARVRIKEEIEEIPAADLELVEDTQEENVPFDDQSPLPDPLTRALFDRRIDLHIEELNPKLP